MMSKLPIRCGHTLALVLAGMVAASAMMFAQTAKKNGAAESFTATSANVEGAGETVRIDLLRWSTDMERDEMLAALGKSEKDLANAFQKAPTVGYVWTSEAAGYSIRYATRAMLPDGSERVVVITDRPLGSWQPRLWTLAGSKVPVDHPFTVIELRMPRAGLGEGKTSLTSKVTSDAPARTIALDNYASAPVLLKGVKRTTSG